MEKKKKIEREWNKEDKFKRAMFGEEKEKEWEWERSKKKEGEKEGTM